MNIGRICELLDNIPVKSISTSAMSENFFDALGIEHNEVIVCRLLSFLITPGNLNLGTLPLKLFLENVGIQIDDDSCLEDADIDLEDVIDGNRRVDLVIRMKRSVYPFEVKIRAGDQYAQLYDYYHYYNTKKYEINKIYYLTTDGHNPTDYSMGNGTDMLKSDQVVNISFTYNIKNWLADLQNDSVGLESGYKFILRQFGDVIDRMQKNEEKIDALCNLTGVESCNNDRRRLEALLDIMSINQEELWKRIREKYLLNNTDIDQSKFQIEVSEGEEDPRRICTILYRTEDKYKKIAWLSVDYNLYLESIKRTESIISTEDNVFYWKYLYPEGYHQSKFSLKKVNCSMCKYGKICINKYLEEIVREIGR